MTRAERTNRSGQEASQTPDYIRAEKDHRSQSAGVGKKGVLGRGATAWAQGDTSTRESMRPSFWELLRGQHRLLVASERKGAGVTEARSPRHS